MLNSITELLDRFNVKEEDLNTQERETLQKWMSAVSQQDIGLPQVKEFNENLISAIERELADLKESTTFWHFLFHRKRDLYLKARLKDRLMIRDFLAGPEKAKKWLEKSIQNIKPNN